MIGWAIFFLILALIAALFGFTGIAAMATDIAVILFVLFAILFVATLFVHLVRGAGPPPPPA